MPDLEHLFKDEKTAKLMKDSAKLEQLRSAPETQQLFSMLNQNVGGNLESAAGDAAKGDTAQLVSAIRKLMQNPEGARLIQQMKDKLT